MAKLIWRIYYYRPIFSIFKWKYFNYLQTVNKYKLKQKIDNIIEVLWMT